MMTSKKKRKSDISVASLLSKYKVSSAFAVLHLIKRTGSVVPQKAQFLVSHNTLNIHILYMYALFNVEICTRGHDDTTIVFISNSVQWSNWKNCIGPKIFHISRT